MPPPPKDDRPPPHATPVTRRSDGLNVNQVAERLEVHPLTIRNWMKRWDKRPEIAPPYMPYTQFGGLKLIHPDDVDQARGG